MAGGEGTEDKSEGTVAPHDGGGGTDADGGDDERGGGGGTIGPRNNKVTTGTKVTIDGFATEDYATKNRWEDCVSEVVQLELGLTSGDAILAERLAHLAANGSCRDANVPLTRGLGRTCLLEDVADGGAENTYDDGVSGRTWEGVSREDGDERGGGDDVNELRRTTTLERVEVKIEDVQLKHKREVVWTAKPVKEQTNQTFESSILQLRGGASSEDGGRRRGPRSAIGRQRQHERRQQYEQGESEPVAESTIDDLWTKTCFSTLARERPRFYEFLR
jgi:hypothetical protein